MFVVRVALLAALAISSILTDEQCDINSAGDLAAQLKGMWNSWMIATAVRFDIAEHLRKQPLSIEDLAKVTDTKPRALIRLMRALKFYKVFDQTKDGKWKLTPVSQHLTNDDECSLKSLANLIVIDEYKIWPNLWKVMKTGEAEVPRLYGTPYWDFLSHHSERYRSLREAAGQLVKVFCRDIPKVYDFTPYKNIVDISGNDGTFLTYVLKAAPKAHGIDYDMEYQRRDAEAYFRKHGISDRAKFVGGDFRESMPAGGDLYIMKQSFHDWPDQDALKILKNVADQMRKKPAKMLIINQFMPENNDVIAEHVWDVYSNMMVGGQDRTRKEYEALLKKAGMRFSKVIPTQGSIPDIMEIVLDK